MVEGGAPSRSTLAWDLACCNLLVADSGTCGFDREEEPLEAGFPWHLLLQRLLQYLAEAKIDLWDQSNFHQDSL